MYLKFIYMICLSRYLAIFVNQTRIQNLEVRLLSNTCLRGLTVAINPTPPFYGKYFSAEVQCRKFGHIQKASPKRMSQSNLLLEVLNDLNARNSYLANIPRMTLQSENIGKPLYNIADIGPNALVLSLMHSVYDSVLEATARALRKRRMCFTMYLLHTFNYAEDHRYLFKKLWKYQLRRPLVIANGKDLLTMDPYPVLKVVNVTLEPMSKWFPLADGIRDFKGYTLNMPVQNDFPATYFYKDEKTQKYQADGLAAWMVKELMARLNVTLKVHTLTVNNSYIFDYWKIFELLRKGNIELSPQLMLSIFREDGFDFSYPYISTSRCIMIPQSRKNTIVFLPFLDWKLCLVLAIFLMVYEILFKLYPLYRSRVGGVYEWRQQRSFYIPWIILGIPVPLIKFHPSLGRLRFSVFLRLLIVYFLIAFSGNYVSQIFSSNLTSLLTENYVKETSIKLRDVLSAKVPIIMRYFDTDSFVRFHKIANVDLRYFVNSTKEDLHKHRSKLNAKFMYFLTSEEYDVIDEQQRYLSPKRFRFSNICHGPYPLQFQFQADSHFLDLFHLFILRVHEAGLYEYQKRYLFERAKRYAKLDYVYESDLEKSKITFTTLSAMVAPTANPTLIIRPRRKIVSFSC
uniref:Ionotropic glutamate receptor L-glutamate and glycine-binding domain-containing protein n=1 Tax=Musca domestica TaxID=7370 RepID=A0A1I8N1V8_MUSDO